jgi:hypothetical protein
MKKTIARMMFLFDNLFFRCRWYWWCHTSEWLYGSFD